MPFSIKTMNKISERGLKLFGEGYRISEEESNPSAILVRSAKVDTDEFDGLLSVARAGAGTNNITTEKATEKGVCVFNTPGANANAVCELVFIGLGMALRKVPQALEWVNTLKGNSDDAEIGTLVEKNKSKFAGVEMLGKTMGVIGLGKIGVLVANRARAMGMKVVAYEPFPSVENMHALQSGVTVTSELSDVIGQADFLSLHVPLLAATKGLINKESLKSFKDGGVILNFARGGIVDVDSLKQMLDFGKVATYVTDFPNSTDIAHENCICLPHLGASTEEAEENCATMAVEQTIAYLKYGIVRNSVNFPSLEGYPAMGVKTRIVVINRDVPSMISVITKALGDAGLNIHSFKNESNGTVGYNLIDVQAEVSEDILKTISMLDNIIRVRKIEL
jgi:D-3-phosphoglycerate dehydrogenase / 2-oxoglutarate reductase